MIIAGSQASKGPRPESLAWLSFLELGLLGLPAAVSSLRCVSYLGAAKSRPFTGLPRAWSGMANELFNPSWDEYLVVAAYSVSAVYFGAQRQLG